MIIIISIKIFILCKFGVIIGVAALINAVVFGVIDERSTLTVTLWANRILTNDSISVSILETGLQNQCKRTGGKHCENLMGNGMRS